MSGQGIETTYNCDDQDRFVVSDDTKLGVSLAAFRLILQALTGQTFTHAFTDDTGFVYDSDKSEFANGVVRQTDQRDANAITGATYTTNKDLNWGPGTLTGTLQNGATISGGALICTGAASRNCLYNANTIAGITTKGTLRVVVRPNTDTPNQVAYLWDASSKWYIYFDGTSVRFVLKNDSGGTIVQKIVTGLSWTSGTPVELMFAYDQTPGSEVQYTLVGGTLKTTDHVVGTKNNPNSTTTYYAGDSSGNTSEFDIMEWEVYDEVKETANYTPYYGSMPETIYAETDVILPEMVDTHPGVLLAATDFATTETGAPRYTVQIGQSGNYLYVSGGAWVTSDGTYNQATDAATFLANIGTLPVNGEVYGQFRVHFPNSNTQSSVDNLSITMTAQIYPTDPPYFEPLPATRMNSEDLLDFILTFASTPQGSDTAKVALEVNSGLTYHNGSAWVASDGTVSQSNTAAEIQANKASLLSQGSVLGFRCWVISGDGTTTPAVQSLYFSNDYYSGPENSPDTCIVTDHIYDASGTAVEGVTVEAFLQDQYSHTDGVEITESSDSDTTDSQGYWELTLVPTEGMPKGAFYRFKFTYPDGTIKYKDRLVEDEATSQFEDLPQRDV